MRDYGIRGERCRLFVSGGQTRADIEIDGVPSRPAPGRSVTDTVMGTVHHHGDCARHHGDERSVARDMSVTSLRCLLNQFFFTCQKKIKVGKWCMDSNDMFTNRLRVRSFFSPYL